MDKKLEIVVYRGMTKKFETVYRGNIKQVIGEIEEHLSKWEFVVIVRK